MEDSDILGLNQLLVLCREVRISTLPLGSTSRSV